MGKRGPEFAGRLREPCPAGPPAAKGLASAGARLAQTRAGTGRAAGVISGPRSARTPAFPPPSPAVPLRGVLVCGFSVWMFSPFVCVPSQAQEEKAAMWGAVSMAEVVHNFKTTELL